MGPVIKMGKFPGSIQAGFDGTVGGQEWESEGLLVDLMLHSALETVVKMGKMNQTVDVAKSLE